jgi:hypothetical protein
MLAKAIPGALMVLVGFIWFLQGIGVLHGSPMTGEALWAIVGPILALAGAAMIVWGLRVRSHGATRE